MPSRASREAATSSGLRTGRRIRGSAPKACRTPVQKGSSRQMRGSLSTNSRLAPNSFPSSAWAHSRNAPAAGEAPQSGSMGCQSSQEVPAEARISSFSSIIGRDSQKPVSLFSGDACIKVFGRSQPSRLSALVAAEVPPRWGPATSRAIFSLRSFNSAPARTDPAPDRLDRSS